MTDFARLVLDADTRGLKNAERDLKGVAKEASRSSKDIAKSMRNLGVGLTAGVTAPLGFFAKGAAQAAIDAQEMESAFDVVFGNMSDDVRAWAETTGNSLGRSTQEMQRGALAFQELFGKSLAPDQAAALSKEFAVLTQDLASFKNLSNEVAQQKLFSGLVGEAEPLRAVGVFLSETAVKAKAAELGIGGVNGALTDQEKIVVRGAIIQEQLADAQGDVLRTSESAANQIKKSQAAFEELQVVIGTKLIPAITPLIEKLGAAFTWFSTLPDPVQETVLILAGVAAAVGPVLLAISGIVTIAPAVATAFGVMRVAALALMANPVVLGFAAVVAGIYLAWQNWDKIEPYITAVKDAVLDFWNNNLAPIFETLKNTILGAVSWWLDMQTGTVQALASIASAIWDWGSGLISQMWEIGSNIVSGLVQGIRNAREAVWNALKAVVGYGVDNVKEFLGINSPSLLFMGIGQNIAEGLAIGINDGKTLVADAMEGVAGDTLNFTGQVEDSFERMSQNVIGSLRTLANGIKGGGFFDILEGVLGVFTQLGGAGVFGTNIQSNLNAGSFGGARANGGPVSGGKTYLVGERGPELFSPSASGSIISNDNMKASTSRVEVVPSPYFDVVVDGRIVTAAPALANAGAAQAGSQAARSGRRRVR